jgi:hypothetical protein
MKSEIMALFSPTRSYISFLLKCYSYSCISFENRQFHFSTGSSETTRLGGIALASGLVRVGI